MRFIVLCLAVGCVSSSISIEDFDASAVTDAGETDAGETDVGESDAGPLLTDASDVECIPEEELAPIAECFFGPYCLVESPVLVPDGCGGMVFGCRDDRRSEDCDLNEPECDDVSECVVGYTECCGECALMVVVPRSVEQAREIAMMCSDCSCAEAPVNVDYVPTCNETCGLHHLDRVCGSNSECELFAVPRGDDCTNVELIAVKRTELDMLNNYYFGDDTGCTTPVGPDEPYAECNGGLCVVQP